MFIYLEGREIEIKGLNDSSLLLCQLLYPLLV